MCLSCRCRKSKIPTISQGKMFSFNGSKDITQAKHKEPTLCVPPGVFPIFFLFLIIVFEGGGGGGAAAAGWGGVESLSLSYPISAYQKEKTIGIKLI